MKKINKLKITNSNILTKRKENKKNNSIKLDKVEMKILQASIIIDYL